MTREKFVGFAQRADGSVALASPTGGIKEFPTAEQAYIYTINKLIDTINNLIDELYSRVEQPGSSEGS